jgi:hypothetical protein
MAFSMGVFAQGEVVWKDLDGTDLLYTDTVMVYREAQDELLKLELLIENTNLSTDYYVALERVNVHHVTGASDMLCYGSFCQMGSINEQELFTTASVLKANTSVSTDGLIEYSPNEIIETAILKYYIYANIDSAAVLINEPVDSVVVKYIVEPYVRVDLNFTVDMTDVPNFDVDNDTVYVEVEGLEDKLKMKHTSGTNFFTKTVEVDGNLNYTYKYYANDVAEGIERPEFSVAEEELSFNDIFDFVSSAFDNELNQIRTYPNPFSYALTIENIQGATSIEMSNILGQRVYFTNTSKNKMVLNTGGLKNGVYFVKITDSNNQVQVKRLIKQ